MVNEAIKGTVDCKVGFELMPATFVKEGEMDGLMFFVLY